MVAEVAAHYGQIDMLFANAGIYIPGQFVDGDAELTDEDYDRFHDEACARSVEDMAEYHSEAAEYRAEQRRDAAA